MKKIHKQLGMELKVARIKKNLTQRELAKISGVAETTICFIEQSKITPRPETLIKLANSCNVEPSEWLKYLN